VDQPFSECRLKDPKARVSFKQGNYLWDEVIKKSPDQDFGLHLGESAIDFTGHILFSILFNSPTVGDALDNFCRYFNLLNETLVPEFSIQKDSAALALRLNTSDIIHYRHIAEGSISYYYSLFSRLTEGKLKLDRVHFVHPAPNNIKEHERIFKAPLLFEQKENKFIFKKNIWIYLFLFPTRNFLRRLRAMQ